MRTTPRAAEQQVDPLRATALAELAATTLAELDAAEGPAVAPGTRDAFLALLREDPGTLLRTGGPVHLTASALVVDAAGEHLALVWHRKGGFWVQPGGHLEPGDRGFDHAARREATEETGLTALERLGAGPAMLHRHDLSASFGTCREHWDVQYLFRAPARARDLPLAPSSETPRVRWAPWDDLPHGTVPDLPATITALTPVVRTALAQRDAGR